MRASLCAPHLLSAFVMTRVQEEPDTAGVAVCMGGRQSGTSNVSSERSILMTALRSLTTTSRDALISLCRYTPVMSAQKIHLYVQHLGVGFSFNVCLGVSVGAGAGVGVYTSSIYNMLSHRLHTHPQYNLPHFDVHRQTQTQTRTRTRTQIRTPTPTQMQTQTQEQTQTQTFTHKLTHRCTEAVACANREAWICSRWSSWTSWRISSPSTSSACPSSLAFILIASALCHDE